MPTNIKENGFETLIVEYLVSQNGYEEGSNEDYNKTYAIDETRLFRFLNETQKQKMDELRILESEIEKKKFLDRLSKKISDNGVIAIIRSGFKYKNHTLDFYMVRPSEGNAEAKEAYENNIFMPNDIWHNNAENEKKPIRLQIGKKVLGYKTPLGKGRSWFSCFKVINWNVG